MYLFVSLMAVQTGRITFPMVYSFNTNVAISSLLDLFIYFNHTDSSRCGRFSIPPLLLLFSCDHSLPVCWAAAPCRHPPWACPEGLSQALVRPMSVLLKASGFYNISGGVTAVPVGGLLWCPALQSLQRHSLRIYVIIFTDGNYYFFFSFIIFSLIFHIFKHMLFDSCTLVLLQSIPPVNICLSTQ